MTIKTQLSLKDYIKGNLALLYTKWNMKLILGMAGFVFLVSIFQLFTSSKYDSGSGIIISILMITWIPLLTYFSARKNYSSNARASERIDYIMQEDALAINGESFNSTLSWDKIYKVSKTKNWILIWQSRQSANLIPRRNVTENEIASLKNILAKYQVKNNL
jgi:hypothetical protein